MNSIVIEVSSLQSYIYGPLLGCFLAMRESGFVKDADDFVSLANAKPCWRRGGKRRLTDRERTRSLDCGVVSNPTVSKRIHIADCYKHPPVQLKSSEANIRPSRFFRDKYIAEDDGCLNVWRRVNIPVSDNQISRSKALLPVSRRGCGQRGSPA